MERKASVRFVPSNCTVPVFNTAAVSIRFFPCSVQKGSCLGTFPTPKAAAHAAPQRGFRANGWKEPVPFTCWKIASCSLAKASPGRSGRKEFVYPGRSPGSLGPHIASRLFRADQTVEAISGETKVLNLAGIFFPCPGDFFPDLFCFPSSTSILPLPFHAACYLQHFGAGTFHFACSLRHLGAGNFHAACYLPHFGAGTFYFACYLPHLGAGTFHLACYLPHLRAGTFQFECYLQNLGAGTFHFVVFVVVVVTLVVVMFVVVLSVEKIACSLQSLGAGTFHAACYLQYFGAGTFYFACYLPHLGPGTFYLACYL